MCVIENNNAAPADAMREREFNQREKLSAEHTAVTHIKQNTPNSPTTSGATQQQQLLYTDTN